MRTVLLFENIARRDDLTRAQHGVHSNGPSEKWRSRLGRTWSLFGAVNLGTSKSKINRTLTCLSALNAR
jgi:hypothetical protein